MDTLTNNLPPATAQTGVDSESAAVHEVEVTTVVLPLMTHEVRFKLPTNASLLEVLQEGAALASVQLLPNSQNPLDRLHGISHHDQVGPAIADLSQSLGSYLHDKETTHRFGIELVLAFRVNARWAVATSSEMTPRQILALPAINLDFQEYTLYLPNSSDPLPLDTPIQMTRGMLLEAQKDGKYGGHQECTQL